MKLRVQNPNSQRLIHIYTGGTVFKGCLAVLSGTAAVLGAASIAADANTILGIFREGAATTTKVPIETLGGDAVIEGEYTGSSKTTLTDADLGKLIDIVVSTTTTSNDTQKFNLDDLTGPFQIVGYDNDKKLCYAVPLKGARYI
jgi:hypothetical protein